MTTFRLQERAVRAILLDIEGTTTPIAFVFEVLFPFVRTHLREHLQHAPDAGHTPAALAHLRDEWHVDAAHAAEKPPDWRGDEPMAAVPYVEWLMDRDRKSIGLKLLQGEVWRKGYREGALKGDVFPDVAPAFARWRSAGIVIAIYSSGSELAQRLLFGATADGDLTPFLSGFFDTAVGAKTSPDSYRRIAADLHLAAAHVLFVSDVAGELAAAKSAGCQTLLAVRPGNQIVTHADAETIRSLDEIV